MRRSCPSRRAAAPPRRTRPAPATAARSPGGAERRRPGPGRPRRARRRRRRVRRSPRAGLRAATPGGSAPAKAAARAAAAGRPRRSARRRLSSRPGGTPRPPMPRRWSPSSPVRWRATPPRPAARRRVPPRHARAARAAGRRHRNRHGRSLPPGVRADTCAATGPASAPRPRAGTSQAAPSTGLSSAARRASSVSTRADRKRNASTTCPMASSRSVFSASGPRPARSRRGRSRSSGPLRRPSPRLGGQRVRERRGAGMVRAVAIAQVREGRQEIPGVAALGRQPREGLVQRRGGAGSVRRRGALGLSQFTRLIGSARWRKTGGHGARCYWRCGQIFGNLPCSGVGPKDYVLMLGGTQAGESEQGEERADNGGPMPAHRRHGDGSVHRGRDRGSDERVIGCCDAVDTHRDMEFRCGHRPQRRTVRCRHVIARGVRRQRSRRRNRRPSG